MKRIYLPSILAILLLAFSSCGNSWLDDMKPQTSVESEESITSLKEAEYALNGIYDVFRDYRYYGARYIYYADAKGEDMQAKESNKRTGNYYLYTQNEVNVPTNFWSFPYQVIRNANNVLDFLDVRYEGEQTNQWENIKGVALTMRAMAHFDLVKVHGMPYTKDNGASLGVTIVTEKLPSNTKPSRNTVAEVYDQIIRDLVEASSLISKSKVDFKLNWYSTRHLLARAYLYKGDNQNAFDVASEVIEAAEGNGYKLSSNAEYANAWSQQTTPEYFFVLFNDKEEISNANEFVSYLHARKGYDDLLLNKDYMDLIGEDPKDVRLKLTEKYEIKENGKVVETNYYLNKYIAPDYKVSNIPIYRMSETYLIASEAAVKLSKQADAAKYLNAIVSRANPDASVAEADVTLERVLIERRKELVGEGHRLFDAMRNNQKIVRGENHKLSLLTPETRDIDWNYNKIILPIPRKELANNPNMVQNPGYGN